MGNLPSAIYTIFSVAQLEERLDKPSTPLKPIPEDEESAPQIIDFQETVTAVEGKFVICHNLC